MFAESGGVEYGSELVPAQQAELYFTQQIQDGRALFEGGADRAFSSASLIGLRQRTNTCSELTIRMEKLL
jgi:hypothetical protein